MKRLPLLNLNLSVPRDDRSYEHFFRDPHDHAETKENYRELNVSDLEDVHEWMRTHPMKTVTLLQEGQVTHRKHSRYGTITSIFNVVDPSPNPLPTRCVKTYEVEHNKYSEETLSRHFDNEVFFQNKAYKNLNNKTIEVIGVMYTLRIPQIYGVNKGRYSAQIEMEYIPMIKGQISKPIVDAVDKLLISNGIFHNDMNKGNITERDNTIILLDFGSADYKEATPLGGKRKTKRGSKRKRYTKRR